MSLRELRVATQNALRRRHPHHNRKPVDLDSSLLPTLNDSTGLVEMLTEPLASMPDPPGDNSLLVSTSAKRAKTEEEIAQEILEQLREYESFL